MGHSKFYMGSPKFLSGDGGIARLVWMPKKLKEELRRAHRRERRKAGLPDLYDKIATEENGTEEDEVLAYLTEVGHPALGDGPAVLALDPEGGGSAASLLAVPDDDDERSDTLALSGLQIFKLLPKTNCKDCGFPTCMAFAMQLAAGKAELSQCPHVSAEAAAELGEAAAPPVRKVTVGAGDYGGRRRRGDRALPAREAVRASARASPCWSTTASTTRPSSRHLDTFKAQSFERVGQMLRVKLFAIESADAAKLAARVKKASDETGAGS